MWLSDWYYFDSHNCSVTVGDKAVLQVVDSGQVGGSVCGVAFGDCEVYMRFLHCGDCGFVVPTHVVAL